MSTDTRYKVLRWKQRGWPARRIADRLGISTQAVYEHIHRLEADGELKDGVRRYRRRT